MGSFTVASTSSNECISRHFRFANSRRPLSSQRVRKTAHSHYPRGLTDPRTPTNRANHLQALRNHRSSLGNNSVAQKTNSGSTNFTDAPRVRRCPVHNQKEPMRRNLIVAAITAACLALPGIAVAKSKSTCANSPERAVRACIWHAAKKYKQSYSAALRVARCESTLNPKEVYAGQYGLYQFLASTWETTPYKNKEKLSAKYNSLAAMWMWKHGRKGEWTCK